LYHLLDDMRASKWSKLLPKKESKTHSIR